MARTTAAMQWYMGQDHGAVYGDPEHLYVRDLDFQQAGSNLIERLA